MFSLFRPKYVNSYFQYLRSDGLSIPYHSPGVETPGYKNFIPKGLKKRIQNNFSTLFSFQKFVPVAS